MIDTLENISLQDKLFAQVLGVSEQALEKLSLFQMKNEMFGLASKMRFNNQTITQEEANTLNTKLFEIVDVLEELHDYDASTDYIVDFDNFVVDNPEFNNFCW